MRNFAYAKANDVPSAVVAGSGPSTAYLAGGTELLNSMRLGISEPERIVDLSGLSSLNSIEATASRLRIGALTRLNDVALHPIVIRDYPVLSQAILKAASAQLRNLATIGGNILQRTRCAYFRAEGDLPCNKRKPGSGCAALHGENRNLAIFGWSEACVATQPSDPAVALVALDAEIYVTGQGGSRMIRALDFHRLPGDQPDVDNGLHAGELITHYVIAADPAARRSAYVKMRERASYEFALVSAAAAIDLGNDGRIRAAKLVLGSVAAKPWRLPHAETALRGLAFDETAIRNAISNSADWSEARPLSGNSFKILLAKQAAVRAVLDAGPLA